VEPPTGNSTPAPSTRHGGGGETPTPWGSSTRHVLTLFGRVSSVGDVSAGCAAPPTGASISFIAPLCRSNDGLKRGENGLDGTTRFQTYCWRAPVAPAAYCPALAPWSRLG